MTGPTDSGFQSTSRPVPSIQFHSIYDVSSIRQDFPILPRKVYDKPLIYLDNAATTQKPLCMLDAMRDGYLNVNANVHHGVHWVSQQATDLHEAARETVHRFINTRSAAEVVFTRGTTKGLNLIAATYCQAFMHEGDKVIVSAMEHHSDIVPWQLQAQQRGIALKVIPMTDTGELMLDEYEKLFTNKTKLVSLTQVSNVLSTINPVKQVTATAHAHDVSVVIDGVQSALRFKVDMQDTDYDFFVFSGHKTYGPTGIGVLYGKEEWLDRLPPHQGGGEIISHASFDKASFERSPLKFEVGTPDYIATHGLAAAPDYLSSLGMDDIAKHEHELTVYALERTQTIPGMRIFGEAVHHDAVISFQIGHIHHMDMGTLLNKLGIATRTGYHHTQPLVQRLGVLGTMRASFALYNIREEIDQLVAGIEHVSRMF